MFDEAMNTNDAVLAKFAEVFVTLGGKRFSVLQCKDFEGKASVSTTEVERLGCMVVGHRPTSVSLSFSMTIYKCTELFDDLVDKLIKTGTMPTFDIKVTNEDPASSVGRSTKIYNNCILDGDVLLSAAKSGEDFIEQEISGFCESIERPAKFKNPSYM